MLIEHHVSGSTVDNEIVALVKKQVGIEKDRNDPDACCSENGTQQISRSAEPERHSVSPTETKAKEPSSGRSHSFFCLGAAQQIDANRDRGHESEG